MHSGQKVKLACKCWGPASSFLGPLVWCVLSSLNWVCCSLHDACRKLDFESTACTIWVCCSIHWWITQNIPLLNGVQIQEGFLVAQGWYFMLLCHLSLMTQRLNYFWSIFVTLVCCKEPNKNSDDYSLSWKQSWLQWVLLETLNVWSWDNKCPCKSKLPFQWLGVVWSIKT